MSAHGLHEWYELGVGVHWRCDCGETGVEPDAPAAAHAHLLHVIGPDGMARLGLTP